ncbi:hypothetical protein [Sulfobacillus thermosulfidooxidans]|uniref:hypothetical protein n=1 Tax=Sulfobacillus thermosulfidooxidans TaxID=28034 RepID=UPI0006B4A645|nr:hypothetical protein [Sulfobacillus thermosulfidooxidans]
MKWTIWSKQELTEYVRTMFFQEFVSAGFTIKEEGKQWHLWEQNGTHWTVFIRSSRHRNYSFVTKQQTASSARWLVALAHFHSSQAEPDKFLFPDQAWNSSVYPLKSRDYEEGRSQPEWGIDLSARSYQALQPFRWDEVVRNNGVFYWP